MKNRDLVKRLFAAAVVIIFVGVFSIGTAGAAGKIAREVPKGKSFYDAPDPLPSGKHGDLIWTQKIKTDIPGARAWKILYRSTDINNAAVPVTGIVVAPTGKAPAGGRPVVTYAHGTAGLARSCAITLVDNPAKDAMPYAEASYSRVGWSRCSNKSLSLSSIRLRPLSATPPRPPSSSPDARNISLRCVPQAKEQGEPAPRAS